MSFNSQLFVLPEDAYAMHVAAKIAGEAQGNLCAILLAFGSPGVRERHRWLERTQHTRRHRILRIIGSAYGAYGL